MKSAYAIVLLSCFGLLSAQQPETLLIDSAHIGVRADGSMQQKKIYQYDAQNVLTGYIFFQQNQETGSLDTFSSMRYTYRPEPVTRPHDISPGFLFDPSAYFTYNFNANPYAHAYYRAHGNRVFEVLYEGTYDDQNRLIEMIQREVGEDLPTMRISYAYETPSEGSNYDVCSFLRKTYPRDEFSGSCTRYVFDAEGRILRSEDRGQERGWGDPANGYTAYTYDEDGLLVEAEVWRNGEEPIVKYAYVHDEQLVWVSQHKFLTGEQRYALEKRAEYRYEGDFSVDGLQVTAAAYEKYDLETGELTSQSRDTYTYLPAPGARPHLSSSRYERYNPQTGEWELRRTSRYFWRTAPQPQSAPTPPQIDLITPNPWAFDTEVTLSLPATFSETLTVSWWDLAGRQLVPEKRVEGSSIVPPTKLAPGAYLLRLTNERGEVVASKRVILTQ